MQSNTHLAAEGHQRAHGVWVQQEVGRAPDTGLHQGDGGAGVMLSPRGPVLVNDGGALFHASHRATIPVGSSSGGGGRSGGVNFEICIPIE